MDKSFNSIEELMAYVKKDMANTIVKNSDEIEDIMLDKIQKNVYDAYTPRTYDRRYDDGGLYDRENIQVAAMPTGDGVDISITNNTIANGWDKGEYLDSIIELGAALDGDDYVPDYAKPRPFIEPTEEEITEKNVIQKILKENLNYIK